MVTVVDWPDHLLTLEDWVALPEDNSRSYELVEGVLVVSPRPLSLHQRASWRLAAQLESQLPISCGALTETEVVVDQDPTPTVRVPDVIVVPAVGIEENRPRWDAAEVLLAVEILSAGTKRTDRVTKFAEYAEVGIPHYWILDVDPPVSMIAYRLVDGDYETVGEDSGRMAVELGGTIVTLDLTALVGRRG